MHFDCNKFEDYINNRNGDNRINLAFFAGCGMRQDFLVYTV